MQSILELHNISKNYGSKSALKDISFKVDAGKIVGLLGSNGSGKTTLMKLAAGLLHSKEGQIRVCGDKVCTASKRLVSFMPDRPLTEPWMKVGDAISFFRDFYPDFDEVKAEEMLHFMKLDRSQKVTSLSKGMNERLQLTLALSRKASLYLLDEPIGGVDPVAREKILDAIVNYYSEDSCLIVSTHLIRDIERIFDEVILIKDGQLVAHEGVDDIREKHGKSVQEWFKEVYAE
ncbi:multidrug ABC transporter ATP-binding protein [Paenibacillus oryzae]|uniref:Multidrug ABC transporter ATP-binding protein n=1 Tax=Paenibacillus oryzae TaxID=1844972 RepID=A0A1A5YI71_9BACL|nr:ABC transporter ATP-binding protein [Paenibacillus oryzae]OBR65095.1 multidrug ABC transporter ATP-binding protein [Paenibacillus oryzae]